MWHVGGGSVSKHRRLGSCVLRISMKLVNSVVLYNEIRLVIIAARAETSVRRRGGAGGMRGEKKGRRAYLLGGRRDGRERDDCLTSAEHEAQRALLVLGNLLAVLPPLRLAKLFAVAENQVHVPIEREQLADKVPLAVDRHLHAVVDVRVHLAALLGHALQQRKQNKGADRATHSASDGETQRQPFVFGAMHSAASRTARRRRGGNGAAAGGRRASIRQSNRPGKPRGQGGTPVHAALGVPWRTTK